MHQQLLIALVSASVKTVQRPVQSQQRHRITVIARFVEWRENGQLPDMY